MSAAFAPCNHYTAEHFQLTYVAALISNILAPEVALTMLPVDAMKPLDWREERRLRAWELNKQGLTQREIAQELGVTQGAISQWLKRARDGGGREALYHRAAPGRTRALTNEQGSQLPALLAEGAEAYGFQGNHWTTRRVASLIKQTFGVSYHPGHVSRLLRIYDPDWRERHKRRHKKSVVTREANHEQH